VNTKELTTSFQTISIALWFRLSTTAVDALQDAKSDLKDDFTAVDAGGPEEQFAEDVWANLLGLQVSDGTKSLPLFTEEESKHGILPVGDRRFQSAFGAKRGYSHEYQSDTTTGKHTRLFNAALSDGQKCRTRNHRRRGTRRCTS